MRFKMLLSLIATAVLVGTPARAQELTGTLKKIKDTGTITLGHRESSVPFSYYDDKQQVVGYAMDLCARIVDGVKNELHDRHLSQRRDQRDLRQVVSQADPAQGNQPQCADERRLQEGNCQSHGQRRPGGILSVSRSHARCLVMLVTTRKRWGVGRSPQARKSWMRP
jgi:hypothetical protein